MGGTAASGAARTRNASNNRRPNQRENSQVRRRYYTDLRSPSGVSCCVKYLVFGFNIVFWILGFLMLVVGCWAQFEKNNPYTQLNRLSKFYLDPAWLLIIIGAMTFAIGFSGCIGALRENTACLAIYSSLLGLLLLTELIIVIVVFISKDWIETEMKTRLDDMIILYRDDPDLQTLIDWMQTDWHCCGINKPDDWDKNLYFNSSAKALKSEEAGGVPFSCCVNSLELQNYACGHRARIMDPQQINNLIYTEGCLPKLQLWITNNLFYVGGAILIIGVIQFLGICFAQDLRTDIFEQKAKWSRR
ncbi:Tetraspanin 26A [Aphelenchoides fujianensis]|nr:Tetraspanin 26A [Aphelenchoides fujianensis]